MRISRARERIVGSRSDWIRFVGLLGSSLVSTLFLLLLASQRLNWVTGEVVVAVLTFIQWQTFGLMVAKIGIDQVIFATETRDLSIRFDITKFVMTRSLPMAVIASIVMAFVISPVAASIAMVAILLDVYALAAAAELNARRKFVPVIVANCLNYPLFYILAFIGCLWFQGVLVFYVAFAISSFVRFVWIWNANRFEGLQGTVQFAESGQMAIQQVGNYLLFRLDQLLLPAIGTLLLLDVSNQEHLVFLFKFPELVSAGVVILGIFVFPALREDVLWKGRMMRFRLRSAHIIFMGASAAVLAFSFTVYGFLWNGNLGFHWSSGLPFYVSSVLILPVYAITFFSLGEGHLVSLIRNLAISLAIGAIIYGVGFVAFEANLLIWLVAVQLAVFIVVSLTLRYGDARVLYRREG